MTNGNGLTKDTLIALINTHQKSRETIQSIEDGLTDENFHTMCDLLSKGLYDKANSLTETIFKEG